MDTIDLLDAHEALTPALRVEGEGWKDEHTTYRLIVDQTEGYYGIGIAIRTWYTASGPTDGAALRFSGENMSYHAAKQFCEFVEGMLGRVDLLTRVNRIIEKMRIEVR